MIGQTLRHFKILDKLGEGGMGAVYRAEDTVLGREVAIKVLPDAVQADPKRLARFEREAKLLAALDHPNIAGIYEVGSDRGIHFLAMRLAPGEDLAQLLAAARPDRATSLAIALQIATALEIAHARGIVHRDLKPANVKVARDGSGGPAVQVLDFGLAKAWDDGTPESANLSMSPTLTAHMTQAGLILGTAGYMSPEQARGHPADARSDIWSFGVVLYEMLTGRKLFVADTVSDTLARVLTFQPDWSELEDVPRPLRHLLARCLEPNVSQRLQAIGEARIAIERYLADPSEEATTPSPGRTSEGTGQSTLALAAVAVTAALAAGLLTWLAVPRPPAPTLRKLQVPVEPRVREQSISPDGTVLAYVSGDAILLRPLDSVEATQVPDSAGARTLFWSPDGRWLGFQKDSQLWKVPAKGGTPQSIGHAPGAFSSAAGVAWTPDGALLFSPGDRGLLSLPARGGEVQEVLAPAPEIESDFHNVEALPGGRGVVFVVHRQGDDAGYDTLAVWDGQARKDILHLPNSSLGEPGYAPSGHLLFSRTETNQGVWAVPFSLDDLETLGEPFLVSSRARSPSVASDGTLTYILGGASEVPRTQLTWLDRSGRPIAPLGEPTTLSPFLDVSPDGSRVVVEILEDDRRDLWVYDSDRGTRARLTFEGGEFPHWSLDGEEIVFMQAGSGKIYIKKADGSSERRSIADGFAPSLSSDRRWLIFNQVLDGKFTVLRLDLESPEAEPEVLLKDAVWAQLSPDGRFLAYVSWAESASSFVYVARFPEMSGKRQVSLESATYPQWRADGGEIFYVTQPDHVVKAVSVETEPVLTLGNPEQLFRLSPTGIANPFDLPDAFAAAGDGQRFAVIQSIEGSTELQTPPITVVTNWFEEFREDGR